MEESMHTYKLKSLVLASLLGSLTSIAHADQWDITVTNLTHGNHFTPLLLTATEANTHIFEVGGEASPAVEAMAECGNIAPLVATAEVVDAFTSANPVGATNLLGPGEAVATSINTDGSTNTSLTVVAMILPTNDAFIGLDTQLIPIEAGTYTYYLNGYDAGTEGNDELLNPGGPTACSPDEVGLMPVAPNGDGDTNGAGVVTAGDSDTNTSIHVHRGVLGDAGVTGDGRSDLVNSIHRWQNPVAKVVVTVIPTP